MRVLIVDGSVQIIDRLVDILSEAKNITDIHKAVSYEEAKKLFKENGHDVVLLDIGLPGNESLKLLKEIKKAAEKTCVIILSAHIDDHIEMQCRTFGADFLFDKYYEFEKIRDVVDSLERVKKMRSSPSTILKTTTSSNKLHRLAFENSLQANIVSTVSDGKIIIANSAACKLLGYSKKELLTKSRSAIFDINESSFKKMLKQRSAEGHSTAMGTAIKKSGKQISCEITSAVFVDEDGIEKAITSIADMSQSILKQKNIDTEKEKIVADNIILAKSKQKNIDTKKEKIVADNIILAKSKQKNIDVKKEKIVSDNIILAKSKQKNIDAKKEKIVADNIVLALAKSDARQIENSEWKKYMGKILYDVMWDWNKATGEIYVGDSVEEVFGYKVQNNTINFKDFSRCLLPSEKDTVEEKLWETLSSDSKSWKDSFMFIRQDGSVAATTSRASIVRDEEGNAIHLIGAIHDVSRLQQLEKELNEQISIHEEDSEKFLLAAKLSFDVIWDWNVSTNEVFIGEGFEELFGYTIKNNIVNMTTDWGNYLHPDDKEAVENELRDSIASTANSWEHACRVIKADGTVAKVFVRASIFRHTDGKASLLIGAIQDLSRQKELEEKLEKEIAIKGKQLSEYKESFKLIFNSSSDILYDIDLVTDEIILSDAYEKNFGYKIAGNRMPVEDWANNIHPDDKEAVIQDYFRMLTTEDTEWKYNYRFLKADNSIANVLSSAIVLRNADGKAYRMIGHMQDLSKQKVLEEKLEQEIKLKEKQIADAMEEAKETERADLGKELHDNVNQLLGASRMYLEMAKLGGTDSEMYLTHSSDYTLMAIEEIRKLSKGLTTDILQNLGLCEAIENIAGDTMQVNKVRIFCALETFIENSVSVKFKLSIFRIVQEQLNNILKHAKATKIIIGLSQNKKSIILTISDNGIGFDTHKKQKGIGIVNIKSRALSYNGTADFASQPGQGCVLTVIFPVTDVLLNKG